MMKCDVAIIGAGPYGLSAAAHLRTIKGLHVHVLGEPMSFWERNMPVGMFLRSNWTATQIADPNRALTLEAYQEATGEHLPPGSGTSLRPVPLDTFVRYGQWYQREVVPDLDRRKVTRVGVNGAGFIVDTEDGEAMHARRVVVACGIGSFARRPTEFRDLPRSLASHTSEHRDLAQFAGKKVLVIGGGQSALESAALLHENGAEAEVIAKAHKINWLGGWTSKTLHHGLGPMVKRMLYAPTDVGPAGLSQLCARPHLVRTLPRGLQDKLRKRAVRPAGARWLVNRLREVPIRLGHWVTSSEVAGAQLKIHLNDGTERIVDHILLGTGYQVDIAKYSFFPAALTQAIRSHNGYPILQPGLETSIEGLHILGAPGAWSFGPVMQFVSGTTFASRALTRHIANKLGVRMHERSAVVAAETESV